MADLCDEVDVLVPFVRSFNPSLFVTDHLFFVGCECHWDWGTLQQGFADEQIHS